MVETLKVKNWDKWQTYRSDRGTPPWIKIHRKLLSNPEWSQLSDAEKGQLVSIWIIAADKKGEIPINPAVLRKVCMLDEIPNVNKFVNLGFLEISGFNDGVNMASIWRQHDAPEESRGEENKNKILCASEKQKAPKVVKEFYETAKKKKIVGNSLRHFESFWKAFDYPKGKAKAADAWLAVYKPENVDAIIQGAENEAMERPGLILAGRTPIYAQGWLTGRRWEDQQGESSPYPEIVLPDYQPPGGVKCSDSRH